MSPAVFPEAIQPDSYIPLRVQVYTALRDAIVSGRLKPGERIVEDRVCAELGVSRSPLREALRKLEGEGLISILPRRGAVVTELTSKDRIDLFAVREVLEGLAARLAACSVAAEDLARLESVCTAMEKCILARDMPAIVELNTRFHELITQASGNRWLQEFVASIRVQSRRVYRSSIEIPDRAPESLAEHRLIVDALKRGDPQGAETLAREHVLRAQAAAASAGIASLGG